MDLTGKKIGQIRIEALIGNGGMGDVYRGFDERLERRVAVKVLREEHRLKHGARVRFLREARILSRLNHPGICQIYDLLEHPEADLLVLEYIEGKTLRELADDSLSDADKLRLAATVAEILEAAHSEGIVHRDLKPDNIMVTRDRQVKILDFGIARHVESSGEIDPDSGGHALDLLASGAAVDVTSAERRWPVDKAPTKALDDGGAGSEPRDPLVLGTVAYMSPEQATKRSVTAASDMFTFGLVLQELLTGKRAYPRMPMASLILKVSRGDTQPIAGIDRDLATLIESLLDPEPERRPPAAVARERLLAVLEKPQRGRRRRHRLGVAAAILLVALSSLAAVVHSRLQARRHAATAQRFGQEARDIEWLMRTVYLRPPEDIRDAREQVRERMARLRERMAELGRVGRGSGEYALGRAALALGDMAEARAHLEAAWSAGYRRPEVAAALGLVLVEIYRRERTLVVRIADAEERARQLEALRVELRDPALRFLRAGREGEASGSFDDAAPVLKLDSIDYAEALIAFSEERYDDALARAEAASQQLSGFYEGQALIGKIYHAMGQQKEGHGDYGEAYAHFRRAREAYLQAAEIGRSDPALFLGLCELGEAQMTMELYGRGGDVRAAFDEGLEACGKVLEIDPDNAVAYRLRAYLYFRLAESGLGERQPLLDRAAARAREALARGPGDAVTWKTLGHVFMTQADWETYHGADPRPAAAEALAAYREARRLAPADALVLNSLGNVHSLEAEYVRLHGGDPSPHVAAARDAYRQAIGQDPRLDMISTNAALTELTRAAYELARGGDPRPATERARELLARSFEVNPNSSWAFAVLADAKVIEARYEMLSGRDGRLLLDEAEAACARSLEIYPESLLTLNTFAAVLLAKADRELARGGDAEAAFARALEAARRTVAEDALWARSWVAVAAAHRGLAAAALARGGDPRDHLRDAAEAIEKALGIDPELVEAALEKERIEALAVPPE